MRHLPRALRAAALRRVSHNGDKDCGANARPSNPRARPARLTQTTTITDPSRNTLPIRVCCCNVSTLVLEGKEIDQSWSISTLPSKVQNDYNGRDYQREAAD